MKRPSLEQKLLAGSRGLAPDLLPAVLKDCGAQQSPEAPSRGRQPRLRLAATFAVLALLIVGAFGAGLYQTLFRARATVLLDVNPSIEIRINAREKVLSLLPLNADAKTVVGNMDFSGSSLDLTINALLGSMLRHGYLNADANSVLVSVSADRPQESSALQARLLVEIDSLLSGAALQGSVLAQSIEDDAELAALAAANGVSLGKAELIRRIVQQNQLYRFEELCSLSIHELNLISQSGPLKLSQVAASGAASTSAYVGEQAAKAAALTHAGVSEDALSFFRCELDWDRGHMVYEIDFDAAGVEYEYEINAVSGEVERFDREQDEHYLAEKAAVAAGRPGADESGYIGEARAWQQAFSHAGVSEDACSRRRCSLGHEHGAVVYELDFIAGGYEYEYEIDARSGEVLKYEKEYDDARETNMPPAASPKPAPTAAPVSTPPAGTAAPVPTPPAGTDAAEIGAAQAKSIAMSHAGVTADSLTRFSCEYDREHGRAVYEVEFKCGGYEYEYEIDARTGEILSVYKELDD